MPIDASKARAIPTVSAVLCTCLWVCAAALGCATGANRGASPEMSPHLESQNPERTLGAAVRRFGEAGGRGIVVMKGLEEREAVLPKAQDAPTVARHLARQVDCTVQEGPGYLFLYPEVAPYPMLASLDLGGRLDPSYNGVDAAIAFGAGTRLFAALAMLSEGTGRTVVADNSLAETQVGEMTLAPVPLDRALEALLKSARVARPQVDSTEEYVFLSGPANRNPRTMLLNAGALTETQRALLDTRVDVYLPSKMGNGARLTMAPAAIPLRKAVEPLSRQLGATVTMERGLDGLPVNPVVFRNVRVGTALDLILRQWLEPDFGYEVVGDQRIHIRVRTPSETARSAQP